MFVFVFIFVLPAQELPSPKMVPQSQQAPLQPIPEPIPLPAVSHDCGPDYYGTPPDCVLKDPLVRALEKENELWEKYWAAQAR